MLTLFVAPGVSVAVASILSAFDVIRPPKPAVDFVFVLLVLFIVASAASAFVAMLGAG